MQLSLLLQASIWKSIGGVLLAIIILLTMITIHEFGHYIVGRILKFKINEFSIGFGPAIFKKRSKKTGELFAVRIIPLGGYCAFDGEDEFADEAETVEKTEQPFEELENGEGMYALNELETDATSEKEDEYPEPQGERFNDQAPWKRILVLLAGVTMNYILALLLIMTMFLFIGRPLYKVQVEKPEQTQTVSAQTISAANDLQTGDIILEINGKNVYLITDYFDALQGKKAGDEVPVLVLVNGEKVTRTLTLAKDANFANLSDTNALLDSMHIYGLYTVTEQQSFFSSIGHSVVYSFKIGGSLLRSLGELLTGKLGLEAMGGPVTTIKVTSEVASSSMLAFLNIAAFIGVNLAVFNLLPVPALDGCKIIFCLIEWIRKKPINRNVEAIINIIGLFVLFGFAILVDVLQFF